MCSGGSIVFNPSCSLTAQKPSLANRVQITPSHVCFIRVWGLFVHPYLLGKTISCPPKYGQQSKGRLAQADGHSFCPQEAEQGSSSQKDATGKHKVGAEPPGSHEGTVEDMRLQVGPSEEQEGGQWSVRGKELSGAYVGVGRSAGH